METRTALLAAAAAGSVMLSGCGGGGSGGSPSSSIAPPSTSAAPVSYASYRTLQTELKTAQANLETANEQRDAAQNDVEKTEDELDRIERELAAAQARNDAIQAEIDSLVSALSATQIANTANADALARLKAELDAAREDDATLIQEIEALHEALHRAEQEIARRQEVLVQAQQELMEKQEGLEQAVEALLASEAASAALSARLADLHALLGLPPLSECPPTAQCAPASAVLSPAGIGTFTKTDRGYSFNGWGLWARLRYIHEPIFKATINDATFGDGSTLYYTFAIEGIRTGTNPAGAGRAFWHGGVRAYNISRQAYGTPVTGDARLEMDLQADTLDVAFSNFSDGTADMSWRDVAVADGAFEHSDRFSRLRGAFYGAHHQGVAGTFYKNLLNGVFGAVQ